MENYFKRKYAVCVRLVFWGSMFSPKSYNWKKFGWIVTMNSPGENILYLLLKKHRLVLKSSLKEPMKFIIIEVLLPH